jgi:hypothetical protein
MQHFKEETTMPDHRKLPAFQSVETLAQALSDTFGPPTEPEGLPARLWRFAAAAATAIARGSALPRARFLDALQEGVERLEDLGFTIDLAVRKGALDLGTAVELLEHQTRARIEMILLLEAVAGEGGVPGAHARMSTAGVPAAGRYERQLEEATL